MNPPTYLKNIDDPRLRAVLAVMPDVCRCFDREARSAGHDVRPPCKSILVAGEIINALDGVAK